MYGAHTPHAHRDIEKYLSTCSVFIVCVTQDKSGSTCRTLCWYLIVNSDLCGSGVGAGLDDDDLVLLEVELVNQPVVVCCVQLGGKGEGGEGKILYPDRFKIGRKTVWVRD